MYIDIARVLRTEDPQALRPPCGRDPWGVDGGYMKPPDEPEPLIRVTFRPLETPAAVSSTQERESLRNFSAYTH